MPTVGRVESLLAYPLVEPASHLISCRDRHLDLAHAAAADLGIGRSLRLTVGSTPLLLRTTASGLSIDVDGAEPVDASVALSADDFSALAAEAWSLPGLLYNGRLEIDDAAWGTALAWDPVLQTVLFGRPVYDEAAGRAAGAGTVFDLDAEFESAADALATNGFVVLRQAFGAEDVDRYSTEVNRLIGEATPRDGASWWTTDAAGADQCCRITYAEERSDLLGGFGDHPVMARIAELARTPLRAASDRMDGINCVIKRPDARSGLADLPWHRDCGNGGHPLICPGVLVGLQLDEANEGNGRLSFLAGSHHHAGPRRPDHPGFPRVDLDAQPGDVTVHFGHCMHIAPPPTAPDAGRRVLYCGYFKPELFEAVGPRQSFNDVLFAQGDDVRAPDEFV